MKELLQPLTERTILGKWPTLLLLALAESLGMAVWFSASAVVPALAEKWELDDLGRASLTISVQLGFVFGALASAVFNLADRLRARWLFASTAALAALATALIPALDAGLGVTLFLRFWTGVFLAGVYPVGMKIVATWTKADRGLGIGLLVGALTFGSAAPHLINGLGEIGDWRKVLYASSGLALLGGGIAAAFIEEGPLRGLTPRFNWKYVGVVLRQRDLRLANFGYLGHMWELYAMWAWTPAFLTASFKLQGVSSSWASITAFAVIGSGAVGSLLAGLLADRLGRTTLSIASLVISGACCAAVGFLFGGAPWLLAVVCLLWGFAVVADSAQFSACVSELCHPDYTGTALTLQTSLGFLLTIVTIRLIPTLEHVVGWEWAFAFLAVGPLVGVIAMSRLRGLPAAVRLAGGKR
jgi:MFS family permease